MTDTTAVHSKLTGNREDWPVVKFDDMAQMISERIDPAETDLDMYVGLEHLDTDSLQIRRWGSPDDVIVQKLDTFRATLETELTPQLGMQPGVRLPTREFGCS